MLNCPYESQHLTVSGTVLSLRFGEHTTGRPEEGLPSLRPKRWYQLFLKKLDSLCKQPTYHSPLSGLTATPGTESLNTTRLQLLTPTLQNDDEHLPSSPRTVPHVPMDVSASEMPEEAVKSKGSRSAIEVYLWMSLKCSTIIIIKCLPGVPSKQRPVEGQSSVADSVAGILIGIIHATNADFYFSAGVLNIHSACMD